MAGVKPGGAPGGGGPCAGGVPLVGGAWPRPPYQQQSDPWARQGQGTPAPQRAGRELAELTRIWLFDLPS